MATIFARTTGNDTTGDGSTGNPYLTANKAITVAVAGDTVKLGTGVGSGETSGSGFLNISKNMASTLTIESESGNPADVVITGASGVNNTMINGATAKVTFRNITFGVRATSNYAFRINQAATDVAFEGCVFATAGASASANGLYCVANSTWSITNLSFTSCTWPGTTGGVMGVNLQDSGAGSISNVTFTNCTINSSGQTAVYLEAVASGSITNCIVNGAKVGIDLVNVGTIPVTGCTVTAGTTAGASSYGLSANGATLVTVDGCKISTAAASVSLIGGLNGAGGAATTMVVKNTTVSHSTSLNAHAFLFGSGCVDCIAEYCTVNQTYDFGIVLKLDVRSTVRYCNLSGGMNGGTAGVYCKGSVDANVHHNRISAPAGAAIQVLWDDVTTTKSSGCDFTDNKIIALGTAAAINWGGASDDAGGGICDRNTYEVKGTGGFGTVYGQAVTTLAGVQAAWSTYDVTTNDRASRLGRRRIAVL